MSSFKLTREPKNTLEIEITIPWADIIKAKEKVINDSVGTAEIKGFRKGKAPRDVVEKTLDPAKLTQAAISDIVPQIYANAVNELKIKPLLLPQIHLVEGEEGKDWILHAHTCEAPEVKLDGYREKLKGDLASSMIWTPGKAEPEKTKDAQSQREEKLTQLVDWLVKNIQVEPSDLLIEEEANHMLSRLFDQLQKLGLTAEQYLESKQKTAEGLRAEFVQTAKDNLRLEFALNAIAQVEKTLPGDEELEEWIKSADPKTREVLNQPGQRASLTSALTRRKTLDFLLTLA